MKLKIRKADEFRKAQLLTRLGLSPWQRLLNVQRWCDWFALIYFSLAWIFRLLSEKENRAAEFARQQLLQRHWINLREYCRIIKLEKVRLETRKSTAAVTHYRYDISYLFLVLRNWNWLIYWRQTILRRSFDCWRLLKRIIRAKAIAVQGQITK